MEFPRPVPLVGGKDYHFASKYTSGSNGWTGTVAAGSNGKDFSVAGVDFTLGQTGEPRSNGTSTSSGRLPAFYFVRMADLEQAY